jgi:ABC-type oligopeptide transport system substrate-binding subunit
MKNIVKLAFAAVVALSFAACSGSKTTSTTDSTKVDSAATVTTVDSTAKVDSAKADTTAKDTTKKM